MKISKKIIYIFLFFFITGFSKFSFAETGPLFSAVINGNALTIRPTANHYYPSMGIKLSSGHTVGNCTRSSNGFCLFAASKKSPKVLSLSGSTGNVTGEICLNGSAQYSCQQISVPSPEPVTCASVGGKTVSGSSACWIKQDIPVSTIILRCASVCSGVGLTLQAPGPTNNAILAANVCSEFGFTDPPIQSGPPPGITFIGQVNEISLTSCFWNNIEGTDWNNPGNADYNGATGSYMCPCVV